MNVNVKVSMDEDMSLGMNLTTTVKKNAKKKPNARLQMGMRCCRFAGARGDQIRAQSREAGWAAKLSGCN
jgi:hypothetical protein